MCHCVAEIVIDGAVGSFDKRYSYIVPDALRDVAKAGCRVTVPFGMGNSKKQGMILSVSVGEVSPKTKEILSVTDKEPILNSEMIMMCEWLKNNVFCTYFDAIHTMLPAGLNYRLTDYYSANSEFCSTTLLNESEKQIYDYLKSNGELPLKKIESSFCDADAVLHSLCEKQAVIKNQISVRRMQDITRRYVALNDDISGIKLTARQREIADIVTEGLDIDPILRIIELLNTKYSRYLSDEKGVRKTVASLQRLGYRWSDIKTALRRVEVETEENEDV